MAATPSLIALLTMAPSAFATGDIGALPHIKSLSALRAEARKHFGKVSSQELEALGGWLNRNFFRLER